MAMLRDEEARGHLAAASIAGEIKSKHFFATTAALSKRNENNATSGGSVGFHAYANNFLTMTCNLKALFLKSNKLKKMKFRNMKTIAATSVDCLLTETSAQHILSACRSAPTKEDWFLTKQ